MIKNKLQIGIIGAGKISDVHLEAISKIKGVKVKAIADLDKNAREKLANKYNIEKPVSNYKELLSDKKIDVVDICLPHHLHCKVTLDSFAAGKDVILEKPIALSLDDAAIMIQKARESKRRFFVALNQRFLPCHQKAKELLDRQEIGKPFLVLGTIIGDEFLRMNDPADWKGTWSKAGGGALADTGTHLIDIMQYFFGEPISVTATAKRLVVQPENKGDDNAVVTLEFPNNLMANLVITYSAISNNWSERKDIYGAKGSLHIINEAKKSLSIVRNKALPEYIEVKGGGKNWWSYSVKKAITHFIDCIINGKEPIVTPLDAKKALKTILLCYQASSEGRRKMLELREIIRFPAGYNEE